MRNGKRKFKNKMTRPSVAGCNSAGESRYCSPHYYYKEKISMFYHCNQQETAALSFHQLMQMQAHYLANQQKIIAAVSSGLPVLDYGGYGPCLDCQTADHDTMTDANDVFDRVICCNSACATLKKADKSGKIFDKRRSDNG